MPAQICSVDLTSVEPIGYQVFQGLLQEDMKGEQFNSLSPFISLRFELQGSVKNSLTTEAAPTAA